MTRTSDSRVRHGSTNVFADLALPDADVHLVKAQLVSRMIDVMKARGLNQTTTAERIGVKQPDVSNLIRGHFRGYSVDRLIGFLVALDQDVEIVIKPKAARRSCGRLSVRAALV